MIIDLSITLMSVEHFFADMNPAYADLLKLVAGTFGWIGGLTLFMWVRDKNKHRHITSAA